MEYGEILIPLNYLLYSHKGSALSCVFAVLMMQCISYFDVACSVSTKLKEMMVRTSFLSVPADTAYFHAYFNQSIFLYMYISFHLTYGVLCYLLGYQKVVSACLVILVKQTKLLHQTICIYIAVVPRHIIYCFLLDQ